jgi:asparagine synthase (glutamine-hydrolysing)
MCGIAGILNIDGDSLGPTAVAQQMAASIEHRGPDDKGMLTDGPVAFGFQRLCIIDLETGHQPVADEQAGLWCMFNGEIYNFLELRKQLEAKGYSFRTNSDTEVILQAYAAYGLDFVQHLRGMFAIALWDATKQRLVLVRDRVGKKPLFYGVSNGQLAFASEVKAFLKWPEFKRTINGQALNDYLTFLYVPAPSSIFEGVQKLPPAHMLVADCKQGRFDVQRYWTISATPDRSKSFEFYKEGLREVLAEAVKLRLRSDVPLGAFLSGGIDSTLIVGLMSRYISPVRTFSIGFPDARFDERAYAQCAATAFGTIHTEEVVDAFSVTPDELCKLVWYMDEPFGDSSFIPTYWLSKLARKNVTVALSGDGGDELFAGYPRYRYFKLLQRFNLVPAALRRVGGHVAAAVRTAVLPQSPALAERLRRVQKVLALSEQEPEDQILAMLTYFDEANKSRLYSDAWRAGLNGRLSHDLAHALLRQQVRSAGQDSEPLAGFMARDFQTNMVDDVLVKVDRASMACSLEVRAPFLDHHVVEFALRIPPEYKLRGGTHKLILKKAFADLLPEQIVNRSKKGFEVPFADWFQQPQWRALLVDMLAEERLKSQGIFNPSDVLRLRDWLLDDPEARRLPMSAYQLRHQVWALLVFQIWHDQFMGQSG